MQAHCILRRQQYMCIRQFLAWYLINDTNDARSTHSAVFFIFIKSGFQLCLISFKVRGENLF